MDWFKLSDVLGYSSIVCWIIVFTPQLYENHKRKSGESLSVLFLYTWLVADILAMVGLILSRLETFQIILTVYYTVIDAFLIAQVFYYRRFHEDEVDALGDGGEREPLLQDGKGNDSDYDSIGDAQQPNDGVMHDRTRVNSQNGSDIAQPLVRNNHTRINISLVSSTTTMAYLMHLLFLLSSAMAAAPHSTYSSLGAGIESTGGGGNGNTEDLPQYVRIIAMFCGYVSAVLYIASRLPQIYKNYQLKSCEGLSIWLFILSVAGNLTYVLSIFAKFAATGDEHNLQQQIPYLLGSGGTLMFDTTVSVVV
jgi:uncharacterized protein with PQ loop repeat